MRRRIALGCAILVAGPPVVYLLFALVLALVPVNASFTHALAGSGGVPIYLRSNGVHADVVLPTRNALHDWSAEFPVRHMRDLAAPLGWIAFGWGDRAFMLETPTWRDMRVRTAVAALAGIGDGAMHVEYVEHPQHFDVAPVLLAAGQYRDLVATVRRSFRRDARGAPIPIEARGYGTRDAFYEAVPVYSLRLTCNEWTRQVLAAVGVRVPAWAPLPAPLFWQLTRVPGPADPVR
jgi:uncharacterized protein (TIGR02117 family)